MNQSITNLLSGVRYRQRGTEAELEACLFCGKAWHMYINLETGKWFCHSCTQKGGVSQLEEALGVRKTFPLDGRDNSLNGRNNWYHNKLLLSQEYQDILYQKKRINLSSIKAFKLGLSKYNEFVIPHFNDREVVNFKFFKYDDEGKKVRRFKGGKSVLYNMNCVSELTTRVAITEGEWDAITLMQMGAVNVVGNTLGAGSWKSEWTKMFDKVKIIYIIYDNDKAGIDGAQKLSRILGERRCKIITPPLNDINDCYKEGMTWKEICGDVN